VNSGRRDPRVAVEGGARLEPASAAREAEIAPVENLSRAGAPVRARGRREPAEPLRLTWLCHAGPLTARVIYHEATGDGLQALGVGFEEPIPDSAGMFSVPRRSRA
jgi:hypothetical protein